MPSEVSSDVELVVGMGECTIRRFFDSFWGATRFFNVMMQKFYFGRPCDVYAKKNKFTAQ